MIKKIIKKNRLIYQLAKKTYPHYSYFKNKSVLDRNKALKNKHQGKRCFIVGNGSSINQQDLTKLKNEHVFVCNHFYLHKDLNIIKPAFYSLIEPIILNDLFREKRFLETIKKINSYALLNLKANFLFNIQYKKYIENNSLFLKNKVYYFLSGGSISDKINLDMSKPDPFMGGSVYFMLSIAKYLGFKTIYIIGCDYDHIKTKRQNHFYNKREGAPTVQTSDPFCNYSNLELTKNLYTHLKRMDVLNKHLQKEGVRVFNAGIGGMVDTFPRIDYNFLFRR